MRISDPTSIAVDGGLLPGKIYELVYEVQNPRVVGLGLAAVRDAMAFFHFEGEDRLRQPEPARGPGRRRVDRLPPWISPTSSGSRNRVVSSSTCCGRDSTSTSADRMVFDGARIHVAGGGKGGFNHRFAQTTHHPSDLEGNYFPADHPPFNFLPDGSPAGQRCPGRGQATRQDAEDHHDEQLSRVLDPVGIAGPHRSGGNGRRRVSSRCPLLHDQRRAPRRRGDPRPDGDRARAQPLDVAHLQRAMLVNLDRWVSDGVEPPPSRYPRIDAGELITAAEHARSFPARSRGCATRDAIFEPPRVDYGPDFWATGVFTEVPPESGERLPNPGPGVRRRMATASAESDCPS